MDARGETMTIHDRILYVGATPGDYRLHSGGVECHFDGAQAAGDAPAEFETMDSEVIVFHPDRALTRDQALAQLRELLGVRPVREGDSGELRGPGDLVLSLRARDVRVRGVAVPLTTRELELLRLLLEHRRDVLSADDIARSVWGYETFGSRNFVESHISRLRSKLGRVGAHDVVTTVRGVGYIVLSGDVVRGVDEPRAQ